MPIPLEPITEGADDQGPARSADGRPDPLQWLRGRLEQMRDRQTEEFTLPHSGDGFELVGVYKRLPVDRANEIVLAAEPKVEVNAQLLFEACETILLRDEHGETIIAPGYQPPLNELLDIPIVKGANMSEVRQLVLGAFAGDQQMLCSHAADVYEWMLHLADTDEAALAEESPGGP